jgi:sugar phosphate isomerase/epimerase
MLKRLLGTMITYGYPKISLESELDLAEFLGAQVVEILPEWSSFPDPAPLRRAVQDRGLVVHSVHGCWGGQSIRASRVEIAQADSAGRRDSVDDLRRCIDWLRAAGGSHLVIHPGGLSMKEDVESRRGWLAESLIELAGRAQSAGCLLCVENMPPGVYPGSQMSDLFQLVEEIDHPALALALDTGHANISSSLAEETKAAGRRLATTHVHDNDGQRDTHEPPGHGTIDWPGWAESLERIDYRGPIVLECIRKLREKPSLYLRELVDSLTGSSETRAPGGMRGS